MYIYFSVYRHLDLIRRDKSKSKSLGSWGVGIIGKLTFRKCNSLYDPSCPSVGRSVCHNFLQGRAVLLPCSNQNTCFYRLPICKWWFKDDWNVGGGGRLKNVAGLTWIPDIAQNDAASETCESINES